MSTTEAAETRQDAAKALGAASAALRPSVTGVVEKVAIAGTIVRLARRYPVAALVIGGAVLALYIGRRRAYGHGSVRRH